MPHTLWSHICHKVVPFLRVWGVSGINIILGAAIAVEDGAALGEILGHVHSQAELPAAIKVFEKIRMERAYQMQEASLLNGKLWHFPDGPLQRARDAAMRPEVEGKHFIDSPNQWSDPVTQHWSYGYDAEEGIREAWLNYKHELEQKTGE
jgi:salicylate hydroxylase